MGPSSKARISSPLTFSLCTVLSLAVGCGAHDTKDAEIIGQSESALVFTYFNSAQGHVVTGNPFGVNALAGSTVLDTTDLGAGNAFGCRDCSTTGWQDTQANASQNALSTVAAETWDLGKKNGALSGPNYGLSSVLSSAGVAAARQSVLGSATTGYSSLYTKIVNLIPGFTPQGSNTNGFPGTWNRSFVRTQSRAKLAEFLPGSPNVAAYYAQPLALAESRFRGARSYCAMQQAGFAQAATGFTNQGETDLGALDIKIAKWTLGRNRSDVKVGQMGPAQRVTDSNAANAFVIPMHFTSRLSPFAGSVIGNFPEVAHPVAWTTGDSEIFSVEDPGPYVGGNGPRKLYVNSQHVDHFEGTSLTGLKIAGESVLLATGSISFTAGINFKADFGQLVSHPLAEGRVMAYDSSLAGSFPGLPASRSANFDMDGTAIATRPSAWASDAPILYPHPGYPSAGFPIQPFAPRETDGSLNSWAAPWQPISTWVLLGTTSRYLTNDDRAFAVRDTVTGGIELRVTGGFTHNVGSKVKIILGPYVSGNASVTTERTTIFREHLGIVASTALDPAPFANPPHVAQSEIVVLPEYRSFGKVEAGDFGLEFTFVFKIPDYVPWVGGKEVSKKKKVSLGSLGGTEFNATEYEGLSEDQRLRVGEFTDVANEFDAGSVRGRDSFSHLPAPGQSPDVSQFTAQPLGKTVQSCISDGATATTPSPPPDDPGSTGTTPDKNICSYVFPKSAASTAAPNPFGLKVMPANVCASQQNWESYAASADAAVTPQMFECLKSVLAYMCLAPVHKVLLPQKPAASTRIITRPAPGADFETQQAQQAELLGQCAEAWFTHNSAAFVGSTQAQAEALADKLTGDVNSGIFGLDICEADGTPTITSSGAP